MEKSQLNNPILIAAWPGMGHVAATACYYLIAKLEMEFHAEYAASELFDVDHVAVEAGLIQPFRYPKNQLFVWRNPKGGSDLLVFIGEAQPPTGRYDFCRKLIDFAQSERISKVLTFAAMATASELQDKSRVIGAAVDKDTMHQMLESDIALLRDGSISGMNGILLGVASERKIPGGCLLGEMPGMFINVPYPTASIAVLEAFSKLTGTEIDLSELKLEAERVDKHLREMLSQARRVEQQRLGLASDEDETFIPDPMDNGKLTKEEKELVERLFDEASQNRSKAYELKRELDRLGVFREYEDRFLDLFKTD